MHARSLQGGQRTDALWVMRSLQCKPERGRFFPHNFFAAPSVRFLIRFTPIRFLILALGRNRSSAWSSRNKSVRHSPDARTQLPPMHAVPGATSAGSRECRFACTRCVVVTMQQRCNLQFSGRSKLVLLHSLQTQAQICLVNTHKHACGVCTRMPACVVATVDVRIIHRACV